MSNHSENEKKKEERKQREVTRKEKLAEYFFSLSNTVFGSLVIGVTLMMLNESNIFNPNKAWLMLLFGLFILVGLAKVGNNILK